MFSKTELTLPAESDTYRITTCEILKREHICCLFAGASGMVRCQLRVFMHYLPEMECCHFSGSASCFAPLLFSSALQFFEGVVPFCSRGDIGTRPFWRNAEWLFFLMFSTISWKSNGKSVPDAITKDLQAGFVFKFQMWPIILTPKLIRALRNDRTVRKSIISCHSYLSFTSIIWGETSYPEVF